MLMVGPLEWGVAGAALATVVAQAVSVSCALTSASSCSWSVRWSGASRVPRSPPWSHRPSR
ncbi:hypothetical protein CTI14_72350, partial [Methylobacterium radiotolerans]